VLKFNPEFDHQIENSGNIPSYSPISSSGKKNIARQLILVYQIDLINLITNSTFLEKFHALEIMQT